ncbi:MAG: hypothetical protein CO141_04050 [Candidatus Moranbacteria bacterium CG_4_9_14_3_um_filter_42_9]|nr:MAG: hypothetical protein CO141_04050 [Candidatus Moranbacteria bacterium CG_4_9_14_3_um_filter_42_9]
MANAKEGYKNSEKIFQARGFSVASNGKRGSVDALNEILTKTETINVLGQRILDLEYRAKDISKSLEVSEKRQDKNMTFIMILTTAIVVAFFLALIPIIFDVYSNNYNRLNSLELKLNQIKSKN